jgi:hypothetical protein
VVASAPALSVVVPMYNEESVLPMLVSRLRGVLDALGEPYEVVGGLPLTGRFPAGQGVELAPAVCQPFNRLANRHGAS